MASNHSSTVLTLNSGVDRSSLLEYKLHSQPNPVSTFWVAKQFPTCADANHLSLELLLNVTIVRVSMLICGSGFGQNSFNSATAASWQIQSHRKKENINSKL